MIYDLFTLCCVVLWCEALTLIGVFLLYDHVMLWVTINGIYTYFREEERRGCKLHKNYAIWKRSVDTLFNAIDTPTNFSNVLCYHFLLYSNLTRKVAIYDKKYKKQNTLNS